MGNLRQFWWWMEPWPIAIIYDLTHSLPSNKINYLLGFKVFISLQLIPILIFLRRNISRFYARITMIIFCNHRNPSIFFRLHLSLAPQCLLSESLNQFFSRISSDVLVSDKPMPKVWHWFILLLFACILNDVRPTT